jgi:cell division control protein 6
VSGGEEDENLNPQIELNSSKKCKPDVMTQLLDSMATSKDQTELVMRDEEIKLVLDFLTMNKRSSLYVCGGPGSGKTAVIRNCIGKKRKQFKRVVEINALSLSKPSDIFSFCCSELGDGKGNESSSLKRVIMSCAGSVLLVVDEIDGLLRSPSGMNVLCTLFGLAEETKGFVLIGIANAIDLTDKFLPKLARQRCSPQVLVFRTYTPAQIQSIVRHRCKLICKERDLFEETALQLLAARIAASASGDLRKALELARSSTQLAIVQSSEIIQIGHVLSACQQMFGSAQEDAIRSLPLHQQVILYSAGLLLREQKEEEDLIEFQKFYVKTASSKSLPLLKSVEFNDAVAALISADLVYCKKLKTGKRIRLAIPVSDLDFALAGNPLFH